MPLALLLDVERAARTLLLFLLLFLLLVCGLLSTKERRVHVQRDDGLWGRSRRTAELRTAEGGLKAKEALAPLMMAAWLLCTRGLSGL